MKKLLRCVAFTKMVADEIKNFEFQYNCVTLCKIISPIMC